MRVRYVSALSLAIGLTACTSEPHKDAELKTESTEERRASNMGKFLGEDALTFGGPKKREHEDTGLGVNSYLWRASLDTISFMPIASADPFGGVILTDWYSPPQSPQERLKVNIFILDRQLRSDGVKVSIFRQEWDSSGQWRDQAVDSKTVKDLEHAILAQARHFRTKATK